MVLSRRVILALLAICDIALHARANRVSARELSQRYQLPPVTLNRSCRISPGPASFAVNAARKAVMSLRSSAGACRSPPFSKPSTNTPTTTFCRPMVWQPGLWVQLSRPPTSGSNRSSATYQSTMSWNDPPSRPKLMPGIFLSDRQNLENHFSSLTAATASAPLRQHKGAGAARVRVFREHDHVRSKRHTAGP